ITTTLYELIAALQNVVDPDADALVVATVMHLLHSGQLTFVGKTRTYARQSRHEMRARKISRRGRSASLHPIRHGSPAKEYASREVFVRHVQTMASTTRKENEK